MVERYCLYCITLIITLLLINLCYSSNKLRLLDKRVNEESLPLSVQISNKYLPLNENRDELVPIQLKRGSNANIIEVLNSEEVKTFLQKLPFGILKQLSIIFSLDEYNGYCYLIKLFRYYNKNWKKEAVPLKNCVVKDSEIFGQHLFESQKLYNKLEEHAFDPKIKNQATNRDRIPEQSQISNYIYSNNLNEFTTSATSMRPKGSYFMTTIQPQRSTAASGTWPSSSHLDLDFHPQIPDTSSSSKKFKLHLKNKTENFNFKQPAMEGGFNPLFSPITTTKSNNFEVLRAQQMQPDFDNYKLFQDLHEQIAFVPSNQYPNPNAWTTWRNSPDIPTSTISQNPQQIQYPLFSLSTNQNQIHQLQPQQQWRYGNSGENGQNYGIHYMPPNTHFSQSNPKDPATYNFYEMLNPEGKLQPYSHSQSHLGQGVGFEIIRSNGDEIIPGYPGATMIQNSNSNPMMGWLSTVSNMMHGNGNSYGGGGMTKMLLDLSITILPFLAFGSYLVILLLQAVAPNFISFSQLNNPNRPTISPILRRRSFATNSFPDVNANEDENSFVNELNRKIIPILLSSNFGNS